MITVQLNQPDIPTALRQQLVQKHEELRQQLLQFQERYLKPAPAKIQRAESVVSRSSTSARSPMPQSDENSMDKENEQRLKLEILLKELGIDFSFDIETQDILLDAVDSFIDSVAYSACSLAKHRDSGKLEAKDIEAQLKWNWDIEIPGHIVNDTKISRNFDTHKQRMANLRKH